MEYLEGDHAIAIWYADAPGCDWMAHLVRRGDRLVGEYRFRYHAGADKSFDPFEGHDQKSFYAFNAPAAEQAKLEGALTTLAQMFALMYDGDRPERVEIDGPPEKMLEVLSKKPWAHFKYEER